MTDDTFLKLQGARILAEANDLKRTVAALATELDMDGAELKRIIQGDCTVEEQKAVIERVGRTYPINPNELCLIEDDCTHGVKIVRHKQSQISSRVFNRKDNTGERTPYYEYRDTAMARVAPFRPEWIRELRVVDNADPNNPDVAYNNGHSLHQMTFFIGPVNFYWEVNGKRFCQEMDTGDSNYITPFWPHSFTSRDASRDAIILAVTFGGNVRRSLSELYVLGERGTERYTLPYRNGNQAVAKLVRQHMANECMSNEVIEAKLRIRGISTSLEDLLQGEKLSQDTLAGLAECLNVDPSVFHIPPWNADDEVVVRKKGNDDTFMFPGDATKSYAIRPLARTKKMPLIKGFDIEVYAKTPNMETPLRSSLHEWVFNYGSSAVNITWRTEQGEHTDYLAAGDSAYIQPFIPYAFSNIRNEKGKLCVMRVGGSIDGATQAELSFFSGTERIIEKKCWFD